MLFSTSPCLAVGPVVVTSGRSERVILAMRVIMGGPVTRGMLPASRPEVRAPPRTEEFRQLCA